jgi:hypothetical protein
MTRWLIVVAVALALAVGAFAQATPQIMFEHDGVNVTTFKCVVDGGAAVDLGLPTPTGTTYSVAITTCTPVMVNGSHSLVIQACNGTVCTSAAAITVVKL